MTAFIFSLGSNPNKDSSCLEIEFERYKHPVIFPSKEEFRLYEETLRNSSFNPIHTQGTTNKLLHKSETQVRLFVSFVLLPILKVASYHAGIYNILKYRNKLFIHLMIYFILCFNESSHLPVDF